MLNPEAEALRAEVSAMRAEFKVVQADMREMLDAWHLANGLLKAIRALAAVASALVAAGTIVLWIVRFSPKGH